MGHSPTYHPPEGGECETLVKHGLPLWAEPTVGYCSRRLRPSPMWGSRFVGACAVGPWVGERKPLGKTPCRATPVLSRPTYLPQGGERHLKLIMVCKNSPPLLEEGGNMPYLSKLCKQNWQSWQQFFTTTYVKLETYQSCCLRLRLRSFCACKAVIFLWSTLGGTRTSGGCSTL